MKRSLLVSLLILGMGTCFADTYQCHGVIDTKGDALVTLNPHDNIVVDAHWKWDEDKKAYSANCVGEFDRVYHNLEYYNTQRNSVCPVDYLRLHYSFIKDGNGMLSLVSREGGDRHDSSGYTYAYFYCNKV